jgi:hypothetical protein
VIPLLTVRSFWVGFIVMGWINMPRFIN